MTLIGATTMPCFDREERLVLERVGELLARHPYLRADLGETGPVGRALEDVLSARLGLLHSEGEPLRDSIEARLLEKLRTWETRLLRDCDRQSEPPELRMRYETISLLHPEPGSSLEPSVIDARRAKVIRGWEASRERRSAKAVIAEKLGQNRDFFRHGAMLPFYWARRRRIRRLVPRRVLDDAALRETFFAIEQIGPLVDNFGFKGAAGLPLSTEVALADVAFLYMQLADEFLDELAAAAGGHDEAGNIVRAVYRDDTSERPLRELTLHDLAAAGVDPHAHVTKFGSTLASLFEVLGELAEVIDQLLEDAPREIVRATHLFLHHCFQTYLDEVEICERAPERRGDRLRLKDTAWHFYRKNNMVMMLWLDLRTRLLGLLPSEHVEVIRRWGYLLAAFQIFDDLKDLALDLGQQPSYPLQIAANDFPTEFEWLERRFGLRRSPVTRDDVAEVNLRASRTVRQCMEWSRLIALAHFDNPLLYAWDQRWRKSWTRRRHSFNPGSEQPERARPHAVDRLMQALLGTRGHGEHGAVRDEELAFALDASAYEGSWQIYLALFPNVRAMYRFATLRMWMTASEKALAAKQLLRRYPRASANALLGLTDGDVDHEVARDRLEAFAKLIEA